MSLSREQKVAVLRPLVDRLCQSHIWLNHRHVKEPVTAQRLSEHVMGGAKLGLCPINPGESTCRVAVLDFDSHKGEVDWNGMREAAGQVMAVLRSQGYAPVAWRSSGGKGLHVITTWDTPQDAFSVRAAMRSALEDCAFYEGVSGVAKGGVEIYPRQNELPADGFGNMFVLGYAGASEPIEDL